jgi:peroxiredoxin Q/BCP
MSVEAGDKAPEFEVQGVDGPIRSADFAGKPYVVYFYPKDDTSGCTKEAQDFSALAGDFGKLGVTVLGISKDSVASHRKFIAKYGLAIPLGSDPEGAVIERFGSWVEKSMYGRQYMGIDRSTFLVDKDGVVARVWRKVKTNGHGAEVLKAAQSL